MPPAIRVLVNRGSWIESWHEAWAVIVDRQGSVFERYGEDAFVFARSSLKPFQAFPLLSTGARERWNLSEEELAIACSSHSGTPRQVSLAASILRKAGLDSSLLRCGAHPPLHEPTAEGMLCRHELPTALHNNCSGKHAGMLAVCRHQGWDLATYDRLEHPLQRLIQATIARASDMKEEELEAGVDGCGVPAWRLPLSALARAFASLLREPAYHPIVEAMTVHPDLVAGEGRFDTMLMRACPHLLAKAGAEGVHVGGDRLTGVAWAVKIVDGNRRAVAPLVLTLLERHGLISPQTLSELAMPLIQNRRGETVGTIRAHMETKTPS